VSYGPLRSDDLHTSAGSSPRPELTGYLKQFSQPGLRIAVADRKATAGPGGRPVRNHVLAGAWNSRSVFIAVFVDRPGTRGSSILATSTTGTQTSDRLAAGITDRRPVARAARPGADHMLNLTLVISVSR